MTKTIEFNADGSRRVRRGSAEEAEASEALARKKEAERQREKNRREFEEHRRLSQEVGFVGRAIKRVKDAGKRLRGRKKNGKVQTAAERNQALCRQSASQQHATGDDNHVSLPIAAVNKAALAPELYAISRYVQGLILAQTRQSSEFAKSFGDEERGLLIASSNYVRRNLPHDMRGMADIIVGQVTHSDRAPTISEIGHMITASEDERVRKGGVIGYYRALFQAIAGFQKEFMVTHAIKRHVAQRSRQPAVSSRGK